MAEQPRKLSYNEQRELKQLPEQIEGLENTISVLENKISSADFYSQDHHEVQLVLDQLKQTQNLLDQSLERWTQLEELQQAYQRSRQ